MKAATLVALALLAALCSASHYNSNSRIDDRDSQQQRQQAQPFRAGYEYSFVYNGQISSGLEVSGSNKAPASSDEPQQQAVTRIQAEAKIAFETEQQATLRLERIRVGQLNEQIESPQQVQPMGMFEQKTIEESKLHKLQLPVQFSYNNGVVERVQFQSGDAAWSKNIKRAVLNLIQLNLKKQPTPDSEQQQRQWSSEDQQDEQDGQQSSFQSFTLPEITIEGDCLTTYIVSNRQNGQSSQEQDDQFNGQQQQQQSQYFNVTKTIDFKKCKKIADVAFGFQNQQQQPQCQKCKSFQQQQQQQKQQYGPQQQQSQTCSEECDPKEIKEQQLDRTTAIRFVLKGKSPKQSYGIKRAELVSQYVYKNLRSASTTMQTVVAAELVFRSSQQKQQRQPFQPDTSSQKDTLLYDNEWDEEEKRFYMNGDDDFGPRNSPFANVPKQEEVVKIIRKVAQDANNKINGLESRDVAKLHEAIEMLRMCSVQELKQIYEQIAEARQSNSIAQKKAQQIAADCLALAGTRNAILVLTEKITSGSLDSRQAFQAIRQLSNLPAPSDKQTEIVLRTCQHETVHRSAALKQACWLTFGSMVGELCQQKTQTNQETVPVFGAQSGFSSSHQCSPAKKQTFKQALLDQFHQAQNTYEKVLALKALGNAGIDTTAQNLEQIINKQQENRIVRAQAIDALCRLRTQMPRKIQRILLPVLQNTREHPAVRMTALAMILHTTPERAILDQIAYTLNKERNPQVQAFAYSALKSLSKSKVPCQQRMAKQLKNVLKVANVDEQALQSSRVYHIPIYSEEQNEGVFVNLISSFSHRNNMLPNHLAAVVDTMINDEFELNSLQVALTQQGLEQWYEGLVQSLLKGQSQNQPTRGQRSSSNNKEELRKIFSGLKIKSRRSAFQDEQDDEDQDNQQNGQGQRRQQKQPFAMITTRVGDRDTGILSLDSKSMPQCLKRLAQGQQVSLAECLSAVQAPLHFNFMTAMNLNEKCAKVPTSMGVPLRILQALPMVATTEAELRINADRSQGAGIKAQVKAHAIATALHIQKMDTWTPMISTGVEISRAAEMNVPVEADIQVSSQGAFKATMKTPKTKSRVLGFHSLPSTYALDYDSRTHLLKEKKVKAVQVPQFEAFQRNVDTTLGSRHTGDIFRIEGHVHHPRNPTDFKQLLQLSMCTENHLHFKFDPESAPEEITVRVDLSGFNKASSTGPSLDTYKQSGDFNLMNDEQDFEQPETHDQRRSKLNSYQQKFQSQMYKHQLTLAMETKGGRNDQKAQMQASAECDSKLQFCRVKMDLQRSPILASENTEWTLHSKFQILVPEAVSNVQQLRQSKYQKVNAEGEIEWGCEGEDKQSIKFRLQGENRLSKQWRQQIQQLDTPQQKFQEKQTAFINKYDITAEYQLNHHTQMKLYECFEYVKVYSGAGYWNTDVQPQQGPHGKVRGSAFINPVTMQHVTIVVQTPSQLVRCESVQLSGKVRPFSLVRPEQKQIHSVSHLMNRLAVGSGRAECIVDGKRVETFDDVLYKAPIGKCYSVLAKDCSSEQQPQFAVMMKTLSNGKDKKIKIVTPEQMIECQPEKDDQEKHLQCKVNGQIINANTEEQDNYHRSQGAPTVQYNNEDQTDVTVNVEGVQVRFGCWGSQNCKDQKAWIKLSSQYKEGQCGLCGHYDEQADDEWRMPDNQKTNDMQQFHQSYSLRNGDDCTSQEQSDFYSQQNSHKFSQIGWDSQEDDNQAQFDGELSGSQLRRKNIQNYDDEEQDQDNEEQNQWQAGAYHSDGSSSEEDQWGRQGSQKRKMSTIKKKASLKKRQQKNQQADQDNSEEPIEATKVLEYHQQVCFSEKPVKECPQGTQPTQEKQPSNVRFVCLPRASPETRQMQRQARQGRIVNTSSYQPTSVEPVREPIACF